jgi:hypothetical protein
MTMICRKCDAVSNGPEDEYCVHCGSRNWANSDFALMLYKIRKDFRNVVSSLVKMVEALVAVVGGILLTIFYIAIGVAVLWAFVAAIHFMWDHS